jgi:hypothetical protein
LSWPYSKVRKFWALNMDPEGLSKFVTVAMAEIARMREKLLSSLNSRRKQKPMVLSR